MSSANSVATMNLARLARIFDQKEWQNAATRTLGTFQAALERMPAALPQMLSALDAAMAEHMKAGCSEATETKYMQEAKGILTKEQFAKFKAECKGKDKAKTET